MSLASSPSTTLWPATWRRIAAWMVRRRIIVTLGVFVVLVLVDVILKERPHNVLAWSDPWTACGLSLVGAGVALRSWAVGILRKSMQLTTTGPYRLIRNPLYVGSFLMMFGFCTLMGHWVNFVLIGGPMAIVYALKIRSEERGLDALFGDAWRAYCRQTPRFFPRRLTFDLAADWKLSQWLRSREYQAVLASLAGLAALRFWFLA